MVTIIREQLQPGLVTLRVITRLNDCVWAAGTAKGLEPVEKELTEIFPFATWIKK